MSIIPRTEIEEGGMTVAEIPSSVGGNLPPGDLKERRDTLVQGYYNGHAGLADFLKSKGRNSLEHLVVALLDEVIKETDNLLGNQLIATEEGLLAISTAISAKRAEMLEKAIKAVQVKEAFEKDRGLDFDGPFAMLIFKYVMVKVKEAFEQLDYSEEVSNSFFSYLGKTLEDWQAEVRLQIEEMNSIGRK